MNTPIDKYDIVTEASLEAFLEEVNRKIVQSYQPYGPLVISRSGSFFQAMVRYYSPEGLTKEPFDLQKLFSTFPDLKIGPDGRLSVEGLSDL